MTKTLICTVGGSHEPIVKAIQALKPDHVYFVCSTDDPATGSKGSWVQITGKDNVIKASRSDDKPTLPNIPSQVGLEEKQFKVLQVQPDNLDDVYSRISAWIAERHPDTEQLVADYTGGTKSMSAGLVAAVLDADAVEMQLVSGSRPDLIKVPSGSEMVIPASVEATRFKRRLQSALASWSRFAYDESLASLEAIRPPHDSALRGELQLARGLSEAFAAWDRFDHDVALNKLNQFQSKVGKRWGRLLASLKLTMNEQRGEPLRIFDLWRNAERRAAQGRYDDAVARLYRLLEWSAQWILRERAGIDTSNIPPDRIPDGLQLPMNHRGEYQAGLFSAWKLAAEYGSEEVQGFWEAHEARMRNYIQARNYSILAHGFRPLRQDDWQQFSQWIEATLLPLLLKVSGDDPWRVHELPPQLPTRLELM